jgi:PBP1b-binding outer membrane lipoprotein LpoB
VIKRLSPLVFLAFLLLGCISNNALRPGQSQLESAYGEIALKTIAGDGIHVGLSPECANEADARSLAERDARAKIIQSIESRLNSSTIDNMLLHTDGDLILSPDVFTQSRLTALARNVIAVSPHSYYIERRNIGTDSGLRSSFVAWCRMNYSREQHLSLLEENIASLKSLAKSNLADVKKLQSSGNWGLALQSAKYLSRAVNDLESTYSGFSPSQKDELSRIQRALSTWFGSIRVALLVNSNNEQNNAFKQNLSRELGMALKKKTAFRFQHDLKTSDLVLHCDVDVNSRRVIAGLMRTTVMIELRLEGRNSDEILWRHDVELVESGSNANVAINKLQEQLTPPDSVVPGWIESINNSIRTQ